MEILSRVKDRLLTVRKASELLGLSKKAHQAVMETLPRRWGCGKSCIRGVE
jgi:hypothetical protein